MISWITAEDFGIYMHLLYLRSPSLDILQGESSIVHTPFSAIFKWSSLASLSASCTLWTRLVMDLERLPEYTVSNYMAACTSNHGTRMSRIPVSLVTWFSSTGGSFSTLQAHEKTWSIDYVQLCLSIPMIISWRPVGLLSPCSPRLNESWDRLSQSFLWSDSNIEL